MLVDVPPLRTLRLLSLPLGAAALGVEGAVRRRLGQDPDEVARRNRARTVDRRRRVLGELKGDALKAAQLLSTVEALFPADPDQSWREALTSLQESNPGIPWPNAEGVLAQELGPRWRELFDEFDELQAAAAHRGPAAGRARLRVVASAAGRPATDPRAPHHRPPRRW